MALTNEEISALEDEKANLQQELAAETDESFKELILKDIAQIDEELGLIQGAFSLPSVVSNTFVSEEFKLIKHPKTGEVFQVPKDQSFYIFPGESEPTRIID